LIRLSCSRASRWIWPRSGRCRCRSVDAALYEFAEKLGQLCENGLTAQTSIRGQQERSGSLFFYVSIEERIPTSHPLRRIRKLADQALDRLNPTFCSSTDPDALLARKFKAHPAQLSYRGHVLMENRHALVVDCRVTLADGYGERDAAQEMAADCAGAHQKTVGADKNYERVRGRDAAAGRDAPRGAEHRPQRWLSDR
jgi:hypothetical protein